VSVRPPELELKPEEFRIMRDLFSARLGLAIGINTRASVARKLRERVLATHLASFGEYFHYLRYHPHAAAEWDEVVELLTTHETYFFREDYQLRSFEEEVLPMLAEQTRARRRLSIWSAGCSTGEEAYTIAMLVDRCGLFRDTEVRVFGSDISKRCIAAARRGFYGPTSFRVLPEAVRKNYFEARAGGATVVDRIRALCHFGQMNLLDDERARMVGRVDAIFCRNVLIYLDAHARKRVIGVFLDRLYPGGVLLLGHSESLLNVSTAFELLHLKEDLLYRKPGK
jgi:chemotaxis protein methyltransferase CheR